MSPQESVVGAEAVYEPPALIELGTFATSTQHEWIPGAPGKLHGQSDGIGLGSQSRLHHTSA